MRWTRVTDRPSEDSVSKHPTATIDPTAKLEQDVEVGPYSIIESDVEIGAGSKIAAHVVIKSGTKLGQHNRVSSGAVLGGPPQHLAVRDGQPVGKLVIGNRNCIREYATFHVGLSPGGATLVGDDNYIMVSAHIGHDCQIGNHNIMANNVLLAGHVVVGDRVNFSGAVGVHQFCRVGSFAMVGGQSRVTQDVPPFVTVDGASTQLVGINTVGLRRGGFKAADVSLLKQAYRLAFRSDLPLQNRLEELRAAFPEEPVKTLWSFLSTGQRGFLQDRRGPKSCEPIRLRVWNPVDASADEQRRSA